MKTKFYPFAIRFRNFIALLFTLFIIGKTCAQDVSITADPVTWGWFDAYPSHTVNGNLTITGGVPDLVELGDNFWQNLSSVTGSLIIDNADNLTSLIGLQHLVSIGGDLIIQNCDNLASLTGLENVLSIGGSLIVSNNASICCFTTNAIWALQSVQNITIDGNQNLTQIFGFPNLTSLNNLTLTNNPSITWFAAFTALQSAGVITIQQNQNLTTVGGFEALQTVTWLYFRTNNILSAVAGFPALTSLSYFEILNNPNLSLCCWAINLINLSAHTIAINGVGCESTAAINAPPIIPSCEAGQTVNTTFNDCNGEVTVVLPVPIDNCDLVTKHALFTLGDGSVSYDGAFVNQATTIQFVGLPGVNTLLFTATDASNQSTSCLINITVVDNQPPEPVPNYDFDFTLVANSNCLASFTAPTDGFTDNCGMSEFQLTIPGEVNANIQPGVNANFDLGSGIYSYTIEATDVNGLITTQLGTITVSDVTPPTWDDGLTAKTVEIECGTMTLAEAITANSPSASDCGTVFISNGGSVTITSACGLQGEEISLLAFDDNANVTVEPYILTIEFVDGTAPILSGVPVDLTISCNDPLPGFTGMTAMDACDGDLTNAITFTQIPGMGSCGVGEVAQTYRNTASVQDACGNVTENVWNVTVVSDFSFELGEDINVCGESFYILNPGNLGTSYQWSDGSSSQVITVLNSGIYILTVTSSNGCCFVDQINVNLGDNPEAVATGSVISCATGTAQISGSTNIANSSFSWTGPGGFTSSEQNPNVTDAGEYILTIITPIGCTSSAAATVTGDTDVPDASATGGTVSCNDTTTEISGSSVTSGVSFAWAGPNSFSSSDQNAVVDAPGIYTLTVTSSNGCTATASAEVIDNQNSPAITITGSNINCDSPISDLIIDSDLELVGFAWTGPNSFESNSQDPELMAEGTYELIATASNGCTSTSMVSIAADFAIPDITIIGGTISCTANSIMISVSTSIDDATYLWSGPDEFTSTIPNPSVTQPGNYLVQVKGPNGCTISGPAEVLSDSDLPNVSATGGSINCLNETVTISGSTSTEGATFSWAGPNGYTSNDAENIVTATGTYTFTVMSPSGCESFKDVEVLIDRENPDISLFQGDVDCENGTRQFSLTTNATDGSFEWIGPDGFSSSEQNPTYSLAGIYSIKIIGTNGCVTEASVEVAEDIALTFQITINGSSAEAVVNGGTGPFTFLWDGNNGESNIEDLEVGTHQLSIIDGLGCITTNTFEIIMSGIEDLKENDFVKIYPNPTTTNLTLELEDLDLSESKFSIYDIKGNEVKGINRSGLNQGKNRIETQDLSPGFYLLSIRTKGNIINKKFLKI